MKDSEILREMGGHFGMKDALEIRFVKPKKVLVQQDKDTVYDQVESILLTEFPGLISVDVNYLNDKGFECSISSSMRNFKGITILD